MSANLDAKALTEELRGRWNGRYGVARCIAPSHAGEDRHPSMHIADGRNGRPVLVCRSQHRQDIIEGLKQRGLWDAPQSSAPPRGLHWPTLAEEIPREPAPPQLFESSRRRRIRHYRAAGTATVRRRSRDRGSGLQQATMKTGKDMP